MLISGGCHCRNIAFVLSWEPEPTEISARACTCQFCTKHGAVWTSCPRGQLRVTLREPSLVSLYSFETRTAQFHICSQCGVVPLVTSRIEDHLYAVVNVNALENLDISLPRRTSAAFQKESEQERLSRRTRHWIAHVDYAQLESISRGTNQ